HANDDRRQYRVAVYAIAVSVVACLRGGTRVDVAWNLDPGVTPRFDPNDAVAITPGGGRLGELLGGALDSRLVELAAAKPSSARVIDVECNTIEASQLGVDPGTHLRLMVAPAESLPNALWDHLSERDRIGLKCHLDGTTMTDAVLMPVPGEAQASVAVSEDAVVTVWSPRSTLLVMGGGAMAGAVADAGEFIGWNVVAIPDPDAAVGLAATLSPIDGVVVVGHDIEATGRVLQAALGSRVGYIGSLGPEAVRSARDDWLAYRGVTDTTRISSPAGLPIGAKAPREVGIAVVADMLARHARSTG
ncbi:MAG: XdhC family protein, partial [Acidimicrobiaceae bacterium]|nr:XdhC family protein [Acidimicrobiaceae bacterium]